MQYNFMNSIGKNDTITNNLFNLKERKIEVKSPISKLEKQLLLYINYQHLNGLYLGINFSEYKLSEPLIYNIKSYTNELSKLMNKRNVKLKDGRIVSSNSTFVDYPNVEDFINKMYMIIKYITYEFIDINDIKNGINEFNKGAFVRLNLTNQFNKIGDIKDGIHTAIYDLKDSVFMYTEYMNLLYLIDHKSKFKDGVIKHSKMLIDTNQLDLLKDLSLDCLDFLSMYFQLIYIKKIGL